MWRGAGLVETVDNNVEAGSVPWQSLEQQSALAEVSTAEAPFPPWTRLHAAHPRNLLLYSLIKRHTYKILILHTYVIYILTFIRMTSSSTLLFICAFAWINTLLKKMSAARRAAYYVCTRSKPCFYPVLLVFATRLSRQHETINLSPHCNAFSSWGKLGFPGDYYEQQQWHQTGYISTGRNAVSRVSRVCALALISDNTSTLGDACL
jgi:hypothetical protein